MREATGELNVTVIVVSAVALLSAFFFTTLWPQVRENITNKEKCSDAICDKGLNKNNMVYCYAKGDIVEYKNLFECPYKG